MLGSGRRLGAEAQAGWSGAPGSVQQGALWGLAGHCVLKPQGCGGGSSPSRPAASSLSGFLQGLMNPIRNTSLKACGEGVELFS